MLQVMLVIILLLQQYIVTLLIRFAIGLLLLFDIVPSLRKHCFSNGSSMLAPMFFRGQLGLSEFSYALLVYCQYNIHIYLTLRFIS